jgi:UrcA family protein
MSTKSLLSTIAFTAAVGLAGSALAGPAATGPDQISVPVRLGDLNLHADAGAAVALRRIHVAARSICGGAPDARDLERTAAYRDCMTATVGRAVASLGSPTVTALYTGHGARAIELSASR